ncbi:MAG: 23S rRNA (pseudouridine(1915)-N(3))-methyltransferase RlmH [Bacteroidia bacterium]|nr:MAG: 23S rRNA (pseudouridine(1915)-N(3))-methyltransferase RlmH [Bacteroidia bacterium]
MKIVLIQVGKTDSGYLETGITTYNGRTSRMVKFETVIIPDLRNRGSVSQAEQKKAEGVRILGLVKQGDYLILLDERGEQHDSIRFAGVIENLMNSGVKRILFVIGGPYGFSDDLYASADRKLSLSRLTFSHQMVRLLFAEQLFRAFTLIKGIPYHNE